MDEKKRRYELRRTLGISPVPKEAIIDWIIAEEKQKSKKTEKKNFRFTCRFRALYATQKYGCSGFEGEGECSVCEFRR